MEKISSVFDLKQNCYYTEWQIRMLTLGGSSSAKPADEKARAGDWH
jgi:hypothetical protein